ncbi:HalOD1 output domain-containing protein [Natronobiforma cellulositropha]|uniref:HalOD1 output domain-containing protein n=1 Tax=Natronobiforma cellulositropha TaxID=1679076 RepID=UPI0021D5D314|nr:HalOD1 output domain-containing protein [Natronobiforma cellulositropha]
MSVDSAYGTHDEQTRPSVTETIIEHVADADGRDPLELPPLWDAVDPEALETLFAPTKSGGVRAGRVEFAYCGYWITVEDAEDDTLAVSLEQTDGLE